MAVFFLISFRAPAQLSLLFDYSYDAAGFFSGANLSRRSILETAASAFESRLTDTLSAITPGGSNTWDATFYNPATGLETSVTDSSIPANTLLIYVGARDLGGSILGQAGPGSYSYRGNAAFADSVSKRGESGAPSTDFGPWGGSVAFDSDSSWYFDSDPLTIESFPGQSDFYSVAVHELAHVLGIGTATSWNNLVDGGGDFIGTQSMSLYGGEVPTTSGHWAEGTMSTVPVTGTAQEAAMDPTILVGTRKYFTDLDYAGLDDIGWDVTVVPEPQQVALAMSLALLGFAVWRRRAAV